MKKSILLGGLIVGVGFVPQELVAKGNKAGKPVGFLRIAGKGCFSSSSLAAKLGTPSPARNQRNNKCSMNRIIG